MSDLSNRTLTIKRTFSAPIKLVWEAWTQPEHIAQWWGPKGMETTVREHDFRIDGRWEYAMKMPDGNDFIAEGVYSEIIELEKICTSAEFKPMTEGVKLEVHLKADGDKTNFTFNVIHPTEEYCKAQEKMGFYNGWSSTFDRLEVFVEE